MPGAHVLECFKFKGQPLLTRKLALDDIQSSPGGLRD